MTPMRHLFPALAMALVASGATAQTLRADHPLIGTWQFTGPNRCVETYVVRPDGTAQVTSAEEVAESQLTIDDQPTAKGFYKWVEKTGLERVRKVIMDDHAARKALFERFLVSQHAVRKDPWAERAAGFGAQEFSPIAIVAPIAQIAAE